MPTAGWSSSVPNAFQNGWMRDSATGAVLVSGLAAPSSIALRASATGTTGSTLLTVAKPTGTVDGDVMLAQIAGRGSGTMTCTPPAGWVEVLNQTRSTGGRLFVYRKVASAEAASYDFTLSGASSHAGAILSFSGVNTTTPVDVFASAEGAASTDHVCPSVTTTVPNAVLVMCAMTAVLTAGGSYTWPAGTSEAYDTEVVSSGSGYESGATRAQAAAGASGTTTATQTLSATWASATVALKPA